MIRTQAANPRWRASPVTYGPSRGWQLALVLITALLLFYFTSLAFSLLVAGAAALLAFAVLTAVVWWRPYWAAVALVIGGSLHQCLMMLLLHFTHTALLVKAAQLWKEAVVVALLAVVAHHAFRKRSAPRITLVDLAIVMFMVYGAVYLAFPSSIDESSGLVTKLFGLRLDAFALLAYFVGRGLRLNRLQVRHILVIFAAIVTIIAAIGVVEVAAPNAANAALDSLGYQEFNQQLGDPSVQVGVRADYLGGSAIPRASSLLLSDLGMAFFMLLGVPLITSLYLAAKRRREKIAFNLLLLLTIGSTVLTFTRSAWFALISIFAAIALASRRGLALLLVAAELASGALVVFAAVGILPRLLGLLFSSDEGSLKGHVQALQSSLQIIQQDPFGLGLGTAGPVSQKFALVGGITNESWYFQIATEMGVAGMLLWIGVLLCFGVLTFRRYGQVKDPWLKALCLTMGGATIGFAQVSLTLHAWSGLAISIIFWLLAGIVVNATRIDEGEPESAGAA